MPRTISRCQDERWHLARDANPKRIRLLVPFARSVACIDVCLWQPRSIELASQWNYIFASPSLSLSSRNLLICQRAYQMATRIHGIDIVVFIPDEQMRQINIRTPCTILLTSSSMLFWFFCVYRTRERILSIGRKITKCKCRMRLPGLAQERSC